MLSVINGKVFLFSVFASVSYTHLDVYKRQPKTTVLLATCV
ncbi:hypothetical protein AZZ92_001851, partial [Escherichia coli]